MSATAPLQSTRSPATSPADTHPLWPTAMGIPDAAALHRALDRVVRQVLEALILERLLAVGSEEMEPGLTRLCWAGCTSQGGPVRYQALADTEASFGRLRIRPDSLRRDEGAGFQPIRALRDFLQELQTALGAPDARFLPFAQELHQTWLNDAWAQVLPGPASLDASCAELEASLREAHPYHPCYKSRMGFSPWDNTRYGPEFGGRLRLIWLAVVRGGCVSSRIRGLDERRFLIAELGETTLAGWEAELLRQGLSPEDYALIPVHPWQWRQRLLGECLAELAARRILVLGEGGQDYLPQQSIRSLSNVSRPEAATLKLPLAIVNTSADRILSSHHVCNAGPVSDWLEGMRAADPFLSERLVLLREVLGLAWDAPEEPGPWRERRYGQLSAIWRESVESKLQPGEASLPFAALYHRDGAGRLLLDPWLDRHGLLPWLEALMRRAVLPLLHLLYTQGLGLEAHAQNLILLHRDGWPSRVAVRDLPGGLRFCRADLARPEACPELAPMPDFRRAHNAACSMEVAEPEAVRDFLWDALGFVNLAELAWALRQTRGLPEREFWALLARTLRAYQAERPEHAARHARYDLFVPSTRSEPLARRRLLGEDGAGWQNRPNPLAGL
ncbi:MAG: IucA/IucC family siderophore biosynthesis protein [Gammaproteobacteria bacterium]|nr:IucA/IucC family siderophore biosynthesis protein [Gammaproteobacteria bacterium]